MLTTDSGHDYGVFPNLAEDLELTTINQLWVADITYIRLWEKFVYLAIILDAFSRKLGWDQRDSLEAVLVLTALDRALAERAIPAGVIHHSDQGVQYASTEYIEKLADHNFRISISPKGGRKRTAGMSACTSLSNRKPPGPLAPTSCNNRPNSTNSWRSLGIGVCPRNRRTAESGSDN